MFLGTVHLIAAKAIQIAAGLGVHVALTRIFTPEDYVRFALLAGILAVVQSTITGSGQVLITRLIAQQRDAAGSLVRVLSRSVLYIVIRSVCF